MNTDLQCIDTDHKLFPKSLLQDGDYNRIFAIGNIALLNQPLLGFFCSTKCPGEQNRTARP